MLFSLRTITEVNQKNVSNQSPFLNQLTLKKLSPLGISKFTVKSAEIYGHKYLRVEFMVLDVLYQPAFPNLK